MNLNKIKNYIFGNQICRLQNTVERQKNEIKRLAEINNTRKKNLAEAARFKDEVCEYLFYMSGVLDAYGHKNNRTMSINLQNLSRVRKLKEDIGLNNPN